jgi:SAM-dependent MidA family methyltransferase
VTAGSIADRLGALIATEGPIPVSTYVDHALYGGPAGDGGFYGSGGRAGRRGDFLTAPEVGPLFGAVVAAAVGTWWEEQGRPSSFTVLEWGAGPGTLARAVLAGLDEAAPALAAADALRWVLIERAAAQRALHPDDPRVESVAAWDRPPLAHGVVLANELLDNLPFDIVERTDDGWVEIRLRHVGDGRFEESAHPVPAPTELGAVDVDPGTRLPIQRAAAAWLGHALAAVARGRVVVFDYGAPTAVLGRRGGRWLRTHRDHDGGADWRHAPGTCDITTDVDTDQLQRVRAADADRSQAEWLRAHGIDALVDAGRAAWAAGAAVGDLAALRARSRVREAETLTDPDGMGAFRVLEWGVPK